MKGPSPSVKGKALRVKRSSRRRPFHTRVSWVQQIRRSHVGVKLATSSSSSNDGSPKRPVKVVVVGGDVDGGGDGSRGCVPAIAAGGRPNALVFDSEVEDTDMEVGLYAPNSEEEDRGGCAGRRHVRRFARLVAADVWGYKHGRAVVPSTDKKMVEKMSMVPNLAVEMAMVADLAPVVVVAMDFPVGVATTPDELLPELKGLLIFIVIRVGQLLFIELDVNSICVHAKVMYDIVQGYLVLPVGHLNQMHGRHYHLVQKQAD